MIPAEAVEAATIAQVEACGAWTWDMLRESQKDSIRREVQLGLEAAAPHMLSRVATIEELDALPRFTVIRSGEGAVYERETMWHEAGSRDLKYSPDIALPVTVLQLGWGEE